MSKKDQIILRIFRTEEAKKYPLAVRKMKGDTGFDLYCVEDAELVPGQYVDIHTGIHLELPWNFYAEIRARSGTSKKMIHVFPGIIDAGYRGELQVCCTLLPSFTQGFEAGRTIRVKTGARLAQMILHEILPVRVVEVDELTPSERGSKGFGSSGD